MFPKIFTGVKVLDFSRLLPGPFASELLIKMGAEVHCVLPPSGDPILGDYSPFEKIRRGKKFENVDLKTPEGLKQVQEKLAISDILLEGFRPGTMGRLGLGFDAVKKINPEILYVSIHGYTQDHPKYLLGAHDLNFLVDSGVYSLMYSDDSHEMPALQLADVFGGFYAVFQILAEWLRRGKQGKGCHLNVSIVEGLELLSDYLKDPTTPQIISMLNGGVSRYRIYRTRDQKRIMVGAIEPKFFKNLMGVLKLPYGPSDDGPEIISAVQKKFSEKTLKEWREVFSGTDTCISFIPSRNEVIQPE